MSLARSKRLMSPILAALVLAAITMAGAQIIAPDAGGPEEAAPPQPTTSPTDSLTVGTYNPQEVFIATHQDDLIQQLQGLHAQSQEAQANGDQQSALALQQQAQAVQQQAIQRFDASIDSELPEVAASANVALVALEIKYRAPQVRAVDLTDEMIKALNNEPAADHQTRPGLPLAPPAEAP